MLVLSRRTNETLVIDNNIRFTVLSVHGNQVRIGIEAPEDIIILREEIIDPAQRTSTNTPHMTSGINTKDKAIANIKNEKPTTRSMRTAASTQTTQSGNQHGSEQGKRRGVLGLRRRRP